MNVEIRTVLVDSLKNFMGALTDDEECRRVVEGEDYDLSKLSFDSLSTLELTMYVEDRLAIELDADDVARHTHLNALAVHIAGVVARKYPEKDARAA